MREKQEMLRAEIIEARSDWDRAKLAKRPASEIATLRQKIVALVGELQSLGGRRPANVDKSLTAVRCSDWVGQLEAALRTVKELREARPTLDGTEWAMRAGAQECLEWLVRNERGRCPTIVLDRHPKKTESQGVVAEQHVNDE